MKVTATVLTVILAVGFAFAADDAPVLEFKSKIGFVNGKDKINAHQFFDNDGDETSVYEAETGKRLQTIFDAERVKYSEKTNQIRSSGLDEAGWFRNSGYVYAKDSGGFLSDGRTISFWKVKR